MTPAEITAELKRLGVSVRATKGLPAAMHPAAGAADVCGPALWRELAANKLDVLAELGVAVESCPLCLNWVDPAGVAIDGCDRRRERFPAAFGLAVVNPPCPLLPIKGPAVDVVKCKTCGAAIVWAVSANGRLMPVDAEPVPGGNLALGHGPDGLTAEVVPADDLARVGERYKSHFATCKDAATHRRAK